jgi:hypothetical protein
MMKPRRKVKTAREMLEPLEIPASFHRSPPFVEGDDVSRRAQSLADATS